MKLLKAENDRMWEPLWKNIGSKVMTANEAIALDRLKSLIKIKNVVIDAILSIRGEKGLRIKRKVGNEHRNDIHDYLLFDSITIDGKRVFYKQKLQAGQSINNKRILENTTVVMDDEQLAKHIKELLFAKEAVRKLEEETKILHKIWAGSRVESASRNLGKK